MSYRVEIPTLSVNEVYTLTFEYEGTETIQLIVGDLTLETTDRRVVFTTTSPVNYIESNVKLENLELYEGYYESDDFGGEYTQESIIEGRSLVNLWNGVDIVKSGKWVSSVANPSLNYVSVTEENTLKLVVGDNNYFYIGNMPTDAFHSFLKEGQQYTVVVDVFKNNSQANPFGITMCHYQQVVKGTNSYDLTGGVTGRFVSVVNAQSYTYNKANQHWGHVTGDHRGVGTEIEWRVMILEGDYYDEVLNGNINSFYGIGCVKSPKIVSRNEDGTEESIVSTPNDLELHRIDLYDINTSKPKPSNLIDTVDLTTGIVNKNYMKIRLNDYMDKITSFSVRNHENLINNIQIFINHYHTANNLFPHTPKNEAIFTSATGLMATCTQGGYDGNWNPVDNLIQAFGNTAALTIQVPRTLLDGVDTTNSNALKQWVIDQDFTLIMSCEPYTEQLYLNPLKSYRNGLITTLSQQLAPTLKTTLPISNKFTQTNLSSGQTYNIYFEGTATKLDAGGTVITNPISPCEVECGGTTLTIEGTDIQNVRVLETTVKNEVGNNGTSDVELNKVITSQYENLVGKITFHSDTDSITKIYEDGSFNVVATSSHYWWSHGRVKTGIKNPKGINLYHVEFDVDFPTSNLYAKFQFGKVEDSINPLVPLNQYNFRELKLNNDTASICQSQEQSNRGFTTYISQGHFSKLIYSKGNDEEIIICIGVGDSICGSSYIITDTNAKEGSIYGYTPCAKQGVTISNFKVRLLETNSNITDFSQVTSSLRTNNGLTVIWQDMDMSMPLNTYNLEQPIKLRSLGTTYDSYNLVTGELTKRIGVSETDGSYSVLSSPIVTVTKLKAKAIDVFGNVWITQNSPATTLGHYINEKDGQLGTSTVGVSFYTHDYLPIPKVSFKVRGQNRYKRVAFYDSNKVFVKGLLSPHTDNSDFEITLSSIPINAMYVRYSASLADNDVAYVPEKSLFIIDVNGKDLDCCDSGSITVPYLYTDGQVKVYSESNVYPTTILNGQSTNNYEINGLNTSKNYTVRYEGACESINLANKSNTQGTNRIIKSGATSGNLTFINNSGDINNVLLVQDDVREQEINYFTGIQTVEVSRILIQNQNQSQYIDLPQPVQLNRLPDGTCDTYNPITGEYVQRVNGKPYSGNEKWNRGYTDLECITYTLSLDRNRPDFNTSSYCTDLKLLKKSNVDEEGYLVTMGANFEPILIVRLKPETLSGISFKNWLRQSGLVIFHEIKPITTQLTPIEIPAFEGGILQFITTDGKVFPMIEYSMPTNNRYDTSSWETGVVYTQRNMTEVYFNDSTTPMTPTETMTLTTDHVSSGSIIINSNGDGLMILKGDYTGRDVPYFTGMRSVEAIEIETTPSPDQPLFGKGGRK